MVVYNACSRVFNICACLTKRDRKILLKMTKPASPLSYTKGNKIPCCVRVVATTEGGGGGGGEASFGRMPPVFRVGTEAPTCRVLSLVPFGEA